MERYEIALPLVSGDHSTAKTIAAMANGGDVIPAGVIPLSIESIAYKGGSSTVPTRFALAQNHPNPFNPTTTTRVALPHETDYMLTDYDVAGALYGSTKAFQVPEAVSFVRDCRDRIGNRVPPAWREISPTPSEWC